MSAVNSPPNAAEEENSGNGKRRSYPSGGGGKDDRNFRSLYYEKVGFRGVDERKTIEALLAEDPISREKCAHFALKFAVPSDKRRALWKVVLNASAVYPNNRDFVWKWREKPYRDVTRSLKVMGKIKDEWPRAKNLTVAHLLFTRCLKFDVEKQLQEARCQNFMAVAETLINLTLGDGYAGAGGDNTSVASVGFDEVEVFWIAKGLFALLNRLPEENVAEMVQEPYLKIAMFHKRLVDSCSTSALYSHIDKIGLSTEIPLDTWFLRGFAGILHELALERIWDKVVAGSLVILVYVAVALVETSKMALMQCQTANEAIRCLVSTSQETDALIAQKALEMWSQDGCQVLPGDKGHGGHRPPASAQLTQTATAVPRNQPSISTSVKSGSFQLSSEIKIPDDFDLTGASSETREYLDDDNKDHS